MSSYGAEHKSERLLACTSGHVVAALRQGRTLSGQDMLTT